MLHELIVDLDGCLFDNGHRAHLIPTDVTDAVNWNDFNDACDGDMPIMAVIDFVKHLASGTGNKITFATSRCEIARTKTVAQLLPHFAKFDCTLLMRPIDEHRSASDFKRALFHSISDHFTDATIIVEDNLVVLSMVARFFPMVNRIPVPSRDCAYDQSNHKKDADVKTSEIAPHLLADKKPHNTLKLIATP